MNVRKLIVYLGNRLKCISEGEWGEMMLKIKILYKVLKNFICYVMVFGF